MSEVIRLITERQKQLLKLIVENYIKTARPVSSKALCEIMNCSSATVRNEMVILENCGLISKTHTSSGRVPSDSGYRYYVDNIMEAKELTGEDMLKLQTIFRNNSLVLSDAIAKSMEIVSELTNYTAVVLGNASSDNRIVKIEVIPTNPHNMTAIIITDKGHVENRNVTIEETVSMAEIKQTVDIINRLIVGTPLSEVSKALEFEVKPIIGKYVKQHEALYNAFYNAFTDFTTHPDIKVSGKTKLLDLPEFEDITKIRNLINKFEDKELIKNIAASEDGINVYIGRETGVNEDVSVIKAYYTEGGVEGTIALIGPKRMEYDRAEALLNYIKENIRKMNG